MKDEIPQSVIDSHVKNAANARAEKVKQENSDESKGSMDCFQSPYCVVRFLSLHVENFTFLLHITLHSKTDRATVNKSFNFPCVIQKKHHNPWKWMEARQLSPREERHELKMQRSELNEDEC